MSDIEDIRKRKLEMLQDMQQRRLDQDAREEQEFLQKIDMLEQLIRPKLTKDALQRYGNIKMAHPEKAVQLLAVLGQLVQQNNIDKIDDKQLKLVLLQMQPQKKEFKITRK